MEDISNSVWVYNCSPYKDIEHKCSHLSILYFTTRTCRQFGKIKDWISKY